MPTAARRGRKKTGPSIEDVARLAGVSAQTVSRVSTGANPVRESTRARVLAAMDQLGYSPNRAARALRNGTFGTIGLVAHRFERTGEALITAAVAEAAQAAGYAITLLGVRGPEATDWEHSAQRLTHQGVDGLIIIRAEQTAPESLALPAGLPVVASDSRFVGYYPTVAADQTQGTQDAVSHLLELGHRTIHHIAGPADAMASQVRTGTWRRRLEEAGVRPPDLWRGDWTGGSGYRAGLQIAADPSITAVFCANDEMAFGLMRALYEAGRRVPEDVSVVGFDGIALSEFSAPALTTVRQDFGTVGRELVRLVIEQIRSAGVPPQVRLLVPTELIVRSTTAPPPVR
ncbi:MAG: LacI family transcriptional regulator [Actinobacteria bacterium]|nr:LacI family transcriptional regulator [Actinomycetota bacterium]